MAALRNLAITELRLSGTTNIAQRYDTTPATPAVQSTPTGSRNHFAWALALERGLAAP
jgi:hypothetical protein